MTQGNYMTFLDSRFLLYSGLFGMGFPGSYWPLGQFSTPFQWVIFQTDPWNKLKKCLALAEGAISPWLSSFLGVSLSLFSRSSAAGLDTVLSISQLT